MMVRSVRKKDTVVWYMVWLVLLWHSDDGGSYCIYPTNRERKGITFSRSATDEVFMAS